MGMYRCAACGSSHVVVDTKKEGFSVSKAIAGTVLFGTGGAVMGVNGKEQLYYHCAACGQTLSYPMPEFAKTSIDKYLLEPEKYRYFLEREKKQYPNIEWSADSTDTLNADVQIAEKLSESDLPDTKNEVEFEKLKEVILEALSRDVSKTVSDLQATNEKCILYSNQQLSACLIKMVNAGLLEKNKVEGKVYFSLAGTTKRIEGKKREEYLQRKQETKAYNEKLNEQIAILQQERIEQGVIYAQNVKKNWGAGAKAKKAASNRIAEIDAEIKKLRDSMK